MDEQGEQQLRTTGQLRQFPLHMVEVTSSLPPLTSGSSSSSAHLLPEHHTLVVDTISGSVALIDWQSGESRAKCRFDDKELPLLITLFETWPSYVPYERLLSFFEDIEVTDQLRSDLERVRESGKKGESNVEKALNEQARQRVQPVLKSIHTMLVSCRSNLQGLGLNIFAVLDYGPILVRYIPK